MKQDMHDQSNGGGSAEVSYDIRILLAMRWSIRAVDIHSSRLKLDFNVTTPQLICLHRLDRDGAMPLVQLAERINLSVSTLNGVIDRLEAKGWVQRQRSTQDRRKVYASLTEAGRQVTTNAPSLLQDRLAQALRALSQLEQAAIALSLERVVDLMGAGDIDASPNLIPGERITETNEGNSS